MGDIVELRLHWLLGIFYPGESWREEVVEHVKQRYNVIPAAETYITCEKSGYWFFEMHSD